jgi:hypothetical protein
VAELARSYSLSLAGDSAVVVAQSLVVPTLQELWAVDIRDVRHPGPPRRIDAGLMYWNSLAIGDGLIFATGSEYILGPRLLFYVFVIP